jgi:cyclic pyranopterin phosphate synthase
MGELSHIDAEGRARMVDVTDKPVTAREAAAEGYVRMSEATRALAMSGAGKKGEVLTTAELAGVMAAKRTAELIPLCHPLPLSSIKVAVEPADGGLRVIARVKTTGQTGVEMEALTAVSVAIEGLRVIAKSGGRSGDWTA